MKRLAILLFVLMILSSISYAATIQGKIYDFSLNEIKNLIVEIDSLPMQKIVSKDGSYSFNISQGKYNLTAKTIKQITIAKESIEINKEGTYTIDLFVLPEISENEDLLEDLNIEIESINTEEEKNYLMLIASLILIAIVTISYYFYTKKSKTNPPQSLLQIDTTEPEDLPKRILDIIKKSDGRITQKELRKHFPLSEAKISLILTELETKSKIEKIKKGRGNIIILKK